VGGLHPPVEVLLGHPGVIDDQSGEIHRFGNAGLVKLQRQCVVLLDAFLNLLDILDADPEERLARPVVDQHLLDGRLTQGLEFIDDFLGGHG
jgi:hypothetical protein